MLLAATQPTPLPGFHTAMRTGSQAGKRDSSPAGTCRFTRSVVGEAGLGNFICAYGRSGKRYVFSFVRHEQAALYQNAVFATGDFAGGRMVLALRPDGLGATSRTLFVHLVENAAESREVYNDLQDAGWCD